MFRHWIGVVALSAFAFSAQAQSKNGDGPSNPHFSWYHVPTDVRAIAVANIVTMSSNPLGSGLVNLAAGMHTDHAIPCAEDPLTHGLPNAAFGQGLGGGSVPPGFFKGGTPPAPVANPGSPNGKGSANGDATDIMPEPAWWGLGVAESAKEKSVPLVPVEIQPTIDTPEPATFLMGGMGLAAMAGWRLRRKRS